MQTSITKNFPCYPAGHRQHRHDGHCRFIHGHDWSFDITFAGTKDSMGFIIDFGKMDYIKDYLKNNFDHTLLVEASDPEIAAFRELDNNIADVRIVEAASCEGLAEKVFAEVGQMVRFRTGGRVRVSAVTVWEDNKNSATVIE